MTMFLKRDFFNLAVFSFFKLSFKPYIFSYKPFFSLFPEHPYNFSYKKRPLAVLGIGLGCSFSVSENLFNDDLKAFCERLLLTHNDAVNDS